LSQESVKERILEAALDVFSIKGFEASSIDEIAQIAHMKGPNLYKYFKGKEEIFRELNNSSEEFYQRGMLVDSDMPLWIHNAEEFKTFAMRQVAFTVNSDRIRKLRKMCTIEQFRNEFLAKKASEHQFYNIYGIYTKIFQSLKGKGMISHEDPEMLALSYIAPITLYVQMCDREPDRKEEILRSIERYIDYFVRENFDKTRACPPAVSTKNRY